LKHTQIVIEKKKNKYENKHSSCKWNQILFCIQKECSDFHVLRRPSILRRFYTRVSHLLSRRQRIPSVVPNAIALEFPPTKILEEPKWAYRRQGQE
jgi:hypothetical protein